MQIVIVLIGISFVTFLLTYLSPGDPVRNMFSATGVMPTEELVQQTRDEMGPVSYTHLDVYKRQRCDRARSLAAWMGSG